MNRIDQYTPYGSLEYSQNGSYADGTPRYSQTQTLAPDQQRLLDLGNKGALTLGQTGVDMLGQVQGSYANPIDTSGTPGIASRVNGGQSQADAIRQAQDAAYNTQARYLDPQFETGQKSLDNSLINQGITQGSEAYRNAQDQFGRGRDQAYAGARDAAVTAGNQEQNTLYGQGLSSANLQNSAQGQALSQLFALRNQPLNEYNALATGAQVTPPSFSGYATPNVATTDVAGINNGAYQQQLQAYQTQMAGINNLFGLGGTLGAAAILA